MARQQLIRPAGIPFHVGDWLVEPGLNRVARGHDIHHLEPQVMDLLVFLASRAGQVVSKDQIIDGVWEGRFIAETTLTRSIADLRHALGDEVQQPRFIETIPKRGYRVVANVSGITASPGVPQGDRGAAPGPSPPTPSVLVLPFASLGPEDADRYFCEGLTEEVINALTRVPGLRVIARTSAFAAAAQPADVGQLGARFGVSHVVEGSARRSGARLRVTVQLIQTSDQCHVWSERYDRDLAEVFAMQDEIATAVANGLRVSLAPGQRATRRPTTDMEAYEAYLEGRHHFEKSTAEGLAKAKACYERAVARDPLFAVAHDALAALYWTLGFVGAMPPRDAYSIGVWECLRAIEIDDTFAEAHANLAMYRKELDYNWAEVHREFDRALDLNPQSPVVQARYAFSGLMPQGHMREAASVLERVVANDPLSIMYRWWLAIVLVLARDARRTEEEGRRMIELAPDHQAGWLVCGQRTLLPGEVPDVSLLERAAELSGRTPWVLGYLGLGYGATGRLDAARGLLNELVERAKHQYVSPTAFAFVSLGLGDVDGAFREMDRAIELRDPHIVPILTYWCLDPLRSDPRFARLLRRMNLNPLPAP